MAQMFRE